MVPKKTFALIVLILIRHFLSFFHFISNSVNVFPDNGLKIEILTYSVSIDSITQPDTSSIQISYSIQNFLKRSIKIIFKMNYSFISKIRIIRNKINVSIFYVFFDKIFTIIWYSRPLVLSNKSLSKSSMLHSLASNWAKASFEFIFQSLLHIF